MSSWKYLQFTTKHLCQVFIVHNWPNSQKTILRILLVSWHELQDFFSSSQSFPRIQWCKTNIALPTQEINTYELRRPTRTLQSAQNAIIGQKTRSKALIRNLQSISELACEDVASSGSGSYTYSQRGRKWERLTYSYRQCSTGTCGPRALQIGSQVPASVRNIDGVTRRVCPRCAPYLMFPPPDLLTFMVQLRVPIAGFIRLTVCSQSSW